jgi:hypothetical protein
MHWGSCLLISLERSLPIRLHTHTLQRVTSSARISSHLAYT